VSSLDGAAGGAAMRKPITFAAAFIIAATITISGQPLNNTALNPNSASKRVELLEGSEAYKAIARLGDLSPAAIRERLRQMRQPFYLPTPLLVSKIIEAQKIPIINDKRVDQLKAALQPVLDYHERSQMPIYVLHSEQPKAHLVERAIIIITTRLLAIASEEELRGIVAHELAHEYVWDERSRAREAKSETLMREFELFCDTVAAFTLKEIGADPSSYGRILGRMTQIGIVAGIAAGNTTRREAFTHPALNARIKLNKFLCQQFK
jgi:hypothetical protein